MQRAGLDAPARQGRRPLSDGRRLHRRRFDRADPNQRCDSRSGPRVGVRERRSAPEDREARSRQERVFDPVSLPPARRMGYQDGDAMTLVWPSAEHLPSYVAALERGWSPDNMRAEVVAREQLAQIAADADAFLRSLVDREARGRPVTLPDGSVVPRLPGYHRWLWDGEFCGVIGFRWQPGTEALPSHCLGHIGYSVVSWKRRRGYATSALRALLADVKTEGLRYVEITTDPDNVASQRVVEANGGVLVEEFVKPAQFGGTRGLRYRVFL